MTVWVCSTGGGGAGASDGDSGGGAAAEVVAEGAVVADGVLSAGWVDSSPRNTNRTSAASAANAINKPKPRMAPERRYQGIAAAAACSSGGCSSNASRGRAASVYPSAPTAPLPPSAW